MTEDEVAMLDRLLDLTDNDLWDLIAGRREPHDATVASAARATARGVSAMIVVPLSCALHRPPSLSTDF